MGTWSIGLNEVQAAYCGGIGATEVDLIEIHEGDGSPCGSFRLFVHESHDQMEVALATYMFDVRFAGGFAIPHTQL